MFMYSDNETRPLVGFSVNFCFHKHLAWFRMLLASGILSVHTNDHMGEGGGFHY